MNNKEIKLIVESLVANMGFSNAEVEALMEGDYIKINIKSPPEQSGILIGRHGEGIDALQLIVNLIVNNQSEEWQRVLVNVNDNGGKTLYPKTSPS